MIYLDYSAWDRAVQPLRDGLGSGTLAVIPGAEVNGHGIRCLANTSNLHFPDIESEAMLLLLDQAGISASSGSACLADSPDPSHVIAAMKPGGPARQSVRFSIGEELSSPDIAACVGALRKAAATLGSPGDRESP